MLDICLFSKQKRTAAVALVYKIMWSPMTDHTTQKLLYCYLVIKNWVMSKVRVNRYPVSVSIATRISSSQQDSTNEQAKWMPWDSLTLGSRESFIYTVTPTHTDTHTHTHLYISQNNKYRKNVTVSRTFPWKLQDASRNHYMYILSYTVVTLLICLISYRALYLAQSTDILCPIESEVLEDLPWMPMWITLWSDYQISIGIKIIKF